MKRVLIVASVISFIEWFNKENIDFLKNVLKCEVHLAVNSEYFADTDEVRTRRYIEKINSEGIYIHNICFSRNPISKKTFASYKQLEKLIDEYSFDLIHCHTPTVSVLTRIAARKARKNGTVVMYTCHGFHFHNSSSKINWIVYYPIERFLSRYCDYLITINKEDYNRAKTFHCKNVRYIPSVGVNINKIKQTVINKASYKMSLGLPSECILILSIGEMIERKNHEVIIRALGKLKQDNIYYAIAGKGPLKEYLEKLAFDLGIGGKVMFLGFRNDIPELCHVADISALPSKIEGLGLAGIEAMAAGIPVISSNVHGIVDYVIDGRTGYAIEPNNVNGFANAIDKLANNQELRISMRKNCFEIVKQFEIMNALNVMWNIYKEVL